MPSRATRGYRRDERRSRRRWRLEVIGCQHTLLQPTTLWYAEFKEYSPCTAVMKKSNTWCSSVFLPRSVLSCMRIPARSLPYSRNGVLSGRAAYANSCICGRCLFGEGSTACDRSFVVVSQLWAELLYSTALNCQHSVSLVSCAVRVPGRVGSNFRNQFASPVTYT